MRIIVDIGHPAHVHFFKNFIWEMRARGHEILITASKKDLTLDLLKAYTIDYIFTCKRFNGIKFGYELIKRDAQMFKLVKTFKADIITGIHSTIAAHVSKVTKAKSIIFTDTEHAKLANLVTFPFTDIICTPSCFKKNLGKKQVRYNGYHELAYLHPNYFKPDPTVLEELGLTEGEKFVIVRFVAWQATHDINLRGLSNKKELVEKLENYGKVFITSESELSKELRKYKMTISPEKLHSALYYASLCFGDGSTTAVEAALLGTPTVHFEAFKSKSKRPVDATRFGIIDELANKYGVLYTFANQNNAIDKALELLQDGNAKQKLKFRREQLLKDKIDVTKFMVNFIETYAEQHKS